MIQCSWTFCNGTRHYFSCLANKLLCSPLQYNERVNGASPSSLSENLFPTRSAKVSWTVIIQHPLRCFNVCSIILSTWALSFYWHRAASSSSHLRCKRLPTSVWILLAETVITLISSLTNGSGYSCRRKIKFAAVIHGPSIKICLKIKRQKKLIFFNCPLLKIKVLLLLQAFAWVLKCVLRLEYSGLWLVRT